MRKMTYMLFQFRQSFLPPLDYSNSNSLLSVLIAQLQENNLKQSVIHMNNIVEILLNIIFRKYVSVSHGLKVMKIRSNLFSIVVISILI